MSVHVYVGRMMLKEPIVTLIQTHLWFAFTLIFWNIS